MHNFLKLLLTPEFFFSILRISAPIIFATLAAVVVEKAGFANIGLEGLMMFSALSGSLASYYSHSWFWGLLAALATGIIMSLVMGFFAFQLKTDIILVGIAINMMGSGGAFMSMAYAQGWSQDMVSGRGFIALAAQAMGGGECLGGMLSAIMFGFAQALGIKFSAIGMDSNLASPIPYAVTIIGLVVFALIRISRAKKRRSAALAKEEGRLLGQGQA